MEFTTVLTKSTDIDIRNGMINSRLITTDIEDYYVSIKWSLNIEARDYGVKDISTTIYTIDTHFIDEYGNMLDDTFDFEIVNNIECSDNSIYPSEVFIDYIEQEIIIS